MALTPPQYAPEPEDINTPSLIYKSLHISDRPEIRCKYPVFVSTKPSIGSLVAYDRLYITSPQIGPNDTALEGCGCDMPFKFKPISPAAPQNPYI